MEDFRPETASLPPRPAIIPPMAGRMPEGERAAAHVPGPRDDQVFPERLLEPGALPKRAVDELGGLDLLAALRLQAAAHAGADGAARRGAARAPAVRARRFLLAVKERHLAAGVPVIAPGRLLEARKAGVEFLPVRQAVP